MYTQTQADINWAIIVAIAAQETHIAGIGQNPKINIGSIIKFSITVAKIIYIGNLTSQTHLIIDWNIENMKEKTSHIKVIFK